MYGFRCPVHKYKAGREQFERRAFPGRLHKYKDCREQFEQSAHAATCRCAEKGRLRFGEDSFADIAISFDGS